MCVCERVMNDDDEMDPARFTICEFKVANEKYELCWFMPRSLFPHPELVTLGCRFLSPTRCHPRTLVGVYVYTRTRPADEQARLGTGFVPIRCFLSSSVLIPIMDDLGDQMDVLKITHIRWSPGGAPPTMDETCPILERPSQSENEVHKQEAIELKALKLSSGDPLHRRYATSQFGPGLKLPVWGFLLVNAHEHPDARSDERVFVAAYEHAIRLPSMTPKTILTQVVGWFAWSVMYRPDAKPVEPGTAMDQFTLLRDHPSPMRRSGDCEDAAQEMQLCFQWLVQYTGHHPGLKQLSRLAKQYTCETVEYVIRPKGLHHAIRLRNGSEVLPIETTTRTVDMSSTEGWLPHLDLAHLNLFPPKKCPVRIIQSMATVSENFYATELASYVIDAKRPLVNTPDVSPDDVRMAWVTYVAEHTPPVCALKWTDVEDTLLKQACSQWPVSEVGVPLYLERNSDSELQTASKLILDRLAKHSFELFEWTSKKWVKETETVPWLKWPIVKGRTISIAMIRRCNNPASKPSSSGMSSKTKPVSCPPPMPRV